MDTTSRFVGDADEANALMDVLCRDDPKGCERVVFDLKTGDRYVYKRGKVLVFRSNDSRSIASDDRRSNNQTLHHTVNDASDYVEDV